MDEIEKNNIEMFFKKMTLISEQIQFNLQALQKTLSPTEMYEFLSKTNEFIANYEHKEENV